MCTSKSLLLLSFLTSLAVGTSARKPTVTLGLNTANRGSAFGGLEPHATWSTGTSIGDVDVDGGIDLTAEDAEYFPYTVWGRASRNFGGWDMSAHLEACSKNLQSLALNLIAVNDYGYGGTHVHLEATADVGEKTGYVNKITVAQKLSGEDLTLVPAYDFTTKEAQMGVIYSGLADTIVSVDTSTQGPQMLTVSQNFGYNNQVIPSITTDGDFEIEYRRTMDEGGVVAANFKPNKSVTLKWNDGPWVATLNAPMTGPQSFSKDVNLSFKRDVQVF